MTLLNRLIDWYAIRRGYSWFWYGSGWGRRLWIGDAEKPWQR